MAVVAPPGAAADTLLETQALGKRYGAFVALDAVDLAVRDGEFLTILGPSGSGKTTLLRLIGGFTAPSTGHIRFQGRAIDALPIHQRPFNTVFQDYALFPHMTVQQNVGYGLMVRRRPRAEIRRRVAEALAVVELGDYGDRYPVQLSGGQQQRVALARALICEPRLILLDEPLAALDASLRQQMQRFLKSMQRRTGITFLFVTHDQDEAITVSDRICVMRDGHIEQLGRPEALYYRPASRFVASFFGDNNLLGPCTVRAADAGQIHLDSPLGTLVVSARGDDPPATPLLAVRPESLRLLDPGEAADNVVRVVIRAVDFVGPVTRIEATVAGTDTGLTLKAASRPGGLALTPDGPARVGFAATDGALVAGSESP